MLLRAFVCSILLTEGSKLNQDMQLKQANCLCNGAVVNASSGLPHKIYHYSGIYYILVGLQVK